MAPSRPALRPVTQVSVIAGGVIGVVLVVGGLLSILNGRMMFLFGFTTLVTGGIAIALAAAAWQGKRAGWAYLLALCSVFALNGFFAAPKVVSLPKLKQVTPDLELKLGREKAEARIDADNMEIRFGNLLVCVLFAAPFVATVIGLARSGSDFERRA